MVNLRYLVSMLQTAIDEGTSNIIEACMFLTTADINFFKSTGCLLSLHSTDIPTKYNVKLDRKQLLALTH